MHFDEFRREYTAGGLTRLLALFGEQDVPIEYSYTAASGQPGKAMQQVEHPAHERLQQHRTGHDAHIDDPGGGA